VSYATDRCPACKRRPDPHYDYAWKNGRLAIEVFKCEVCGEEGCERCMRLNSAWIVCKRCRRKMPRERK